MYCCYRYCPTPNTAPPLTASPNTAPIPPLIFKSRIYFSWLYIITPFTAIFQHCRFPTPPFFCQSRAQRYWGSLLRLNRFVNCSTKFLFISRTASFCRKNNTFYYPQVPRSGKDFKLYDTVIPSPELELGGLCGGVWGNCFMCNDTPKLKCAKCYMSGVSLTHVISKSV